MHEYMCREDHSHQNYEDAWQVAVQSLSQASPLELALSAGGTYNEEQKRIVLASLGQELWISYPQGEVAFAHTSSSPIFSWRLIAVNYLVRSMQGLATDKSLLSEEYQLISYEDQLISYKELRDGHIFYPAFFREAISPLAKLMDKHSIEKIVDAMQRLGGVKQSGSGDIFVKLIGFPHFPIYLKLWAGDQELAAAANLLFSPRGSNYLHTEDIAVFCQMIVNFLNEELKK